ncbi:MAG: zinc-ribbon domain-containing protein [Armatimonadota bacterium]
MLPCVNCGAENSDNARFCSACGVPLIDAEPGSSTSRSARVSLEVRLRDDVSPAGRLVHAAFQRLLEGNLEDALLGLDSALTINPELWSAHLVRAVILFQKGEVEAAEEHMRKAVQFEPDAVYHKATLERILAASVHPGFASRVLRICKDTPFLLAVAAAGLVLVIGLALNVSGKPAREQLAPKQQEQVAPESYPPGLLPYTRSAPAAYTAAPHSFPAATTPQAEDSPAAAYAPSQLPSALPPAQPEGVAPPADLYAVPDSSAKQHRSANPEDLSGAESSLEKTKDSSAESQEASPTKHGLIERQNSSTARRPGRAYVGYDPIPLAPSNRQKQSQNDSAALFHRQTVGTEAKSPSDSGSEGIRACELQRLAINYERQGLYAKAAEYFRLAIDAYQKQIAEGRDVEAAQRAITSCQTGLRLVEAKL